MAYLKKKKKVFEVICSHAQILHVNYLDTMSDLDVGYISLKKKVYYFLQATFPFIKLLLKYFVRR